MDDASILTLHDADGNELRCELVAALELDGRDYVVVTPVEGEERMVVMGLSNRDGAAVLSVIDDDAEFERVVRHIEEEARKADVDEGGA